MDRLTKEEIEEISMQMKSPSLSALCSMALRCLELEKAGEWRPEDAAPHEGKFLSLNKRQGNLMAVTWWNPVHKYFKATGGQDYYQFTHWQPLPEPPR